MNGGSSSHVAGRQVSDRLGAGVVEHCRRQGPLTGLYKVVERIRAGSDPDALENTERRVFDDGQVLVLKELHDRLDAAVAAAYGWPADISDDELLTRLVALNKERAQGEARGLVRWLRPDYQIPRFGSPKEKAELDLRGAAPEQEVGAGAAAKPLFPADDVAQTAAVNGKKRCFQAVATGASAAGVLYDPVGTAADGAARL
jgi:hypothetical protein